MSVTMQEVYQALVDAGDIAADPAQTEALPILEDIRLYFENLSDKPMGILGFFAKGPNIPKGAYIWGGVGRGKSFVMDLFYDHVATDKKRRVHFHAFMQEIQAGMHAARQEGVDDALKPVADKVAAEVKLLCFDEMQITDITDAMIVGRLFEALFADGVVVVTTSNRVPDDLYKDGLNRGLFLPFIELIKAHMVVHHLASPTDYRQNRIRESGVYFTPANAEARAEINKLWRGFTDGKSHPLVLHVKGREVLLPEFQNGVARAEFWDLCGRALGPADYLAIVEQVRVLILEDVPLLSRENYNEVKRFVTLIDTLYEARVRLILSAAAVPERLYIEGEGVFEFERTASRLREMQSEGWGAEP